MKIHDKYLHHGHTSFINGKRLPRKKIAEWLSQFNCKIDRKGNIKNASTILDDNWNKFHVWVNEGLNKGTLKGRKISLSNGSAEETNRRRQEFNTLSSEVKDLYINIRKTTMYLSLGNTLQRFYNSVGAVRKFRCGDGLTCAKRYEKDLQQLIDDKLSDLFITYIKSHY